MKYFIFTNDNNEVRVWDTQKNQCVQIYKQGNAFVNDVALGQNGTVFCAGGDKTIKSFDIDASHGSLAMFEQDRKHSCPINAIEVFPNKQFAATCSSDQRIIVYDYPWMRYACTLEGTPANVKCLVSFEGPEEGYQLWKKYLASSGEDPRILIWSVDTHQVIKVLEGHKDWVNSLAITQDGKYLISGSADKTIKVWNLATDKGQLVQTLAEHQGSVKAVAVSKSGTYLASGSNDGTVKLWMLQDILAPKPAQAQAQQPVRNMTLKGHQDWVNSVYISADDQYVVSGSSDRTVILWSIDKGEKLQVISQHRSEVHKVWIT